LLAAITLLWGGGKFVEFYSILGFGWFSPFYELIQINEKGRAETLPNCYDK
jgi:hypothetical protein